ncbi:hypothetical protein ACWY4P_02195 [Streptomyces sp. LZ34]
MPRSGRTGPAGMDGVRGTDNVEQLRLDAVQREAHRPQGHGLIARGRHLDAYREQAQPLRLRAQRLVRNTL